MESQTATAGEVTGNFYGSVLSLEMQRYVIKYLFLIFLQSKKKGKYGLQTFNSNFLLVIILHLNLNIFKDPWYLL